MYAYDKATENNVVRPRLLHPRKTAAKVRLFVGKFIKFVKFISLQFSVSHFQIICIFAPLNFLE